jgi:CHAT domain-containing protein
MSKKATATAVLALMLGLGVTPALAQDNGAQTQAAQREMLSKRPDELFKQEKYAEALAAAEDYAKAVEKKEQKPGEDTGNALNSVIWHGVFARRFERALEAGDRAAALAPANLMIQGNRAYALMFLGRADEALAVFTRHKGETISGSGKWEDVIAQDFAEFQKRGLNPPPFARFKEAMAAAPESPRALLDNAMALVSDEKHAEALPLLEKYQEIVKARQGEEHPDYAEALRMREKALTGLRRFAEAESAIRRALAIDEKASGPEAFSVMADLNNLAILLEETNHLAEVGPLKRRALAISEKIYGPEHPTVAILLGNLASLLQTTDQWAEAEQLKRRALAIDEKNYGPDHTNVATKLNNLASLLEATNRLAEAEPLYRRALAIDEKTYGPDHPTIGISLNNLGLFLKRTNRFAEAEPLMRRALAIDEKKYGPDHPNIAIRLNNLSVLLQETNRLAEAETVMRRALALNEKIYGPDHPNVARSLTNLAVLLQEINRLAEAETLVRRALAIHEKSYGPEHSEVAGDLGNLAFLLDKNNNLAEAESLYRRALTIDEKAHGPNHPSVAIRLGNLASLLDKSDRLAEAELLMRRALAIDEKSYGPEHSDVALRLNNLASLLRETNRFLEAEPLYRRALAIHQKVYGPDHPSIATNLNNLASLLQETNRFAEAEAALRRAVDILEKAYKQEHPKTAASLANLAGLLFATNRLAEAEPLMRRTLAISEKIFGPEHPATARDLNNLAALLADAKRYGEAEPLYRRALAIHEKSYGPEHSTVATSLNNLALLLRKIDKLAEAEPMTRRALAIEEKIHGPEHPSVAIKLLSLGELLRGGGRLAEAEPLLNRALAIDEKSYGPDHPDVARILGFMTWLRVRQGDWPGALQATRRSTAIYIASARRMRGTGGEKRQLALNSDQFQEHAAVAFRAARGNTETRDEAFAMAQRVAANEAAGALAQSLARFAGGNDALAVLAREQQDLARQSETLDKRLLNALGKADQATADAARAGQAKIEARLKEIAKQLERDHPDYVALINPEPLTVAQTQALLAPDEAFVQFLDVEAKPYSPIPETAFAFVITKGEALWLELPLGSKALGDKAAALRCGLDSAAWKEPSGRCGKLLGKAAPGDDLPPFDLARAHELYRDLFGQAEDVIKDKRLLIAPSGALTQLPFQVLVTEAPDASANGVDAYAKARWLGTRNAISVLPSAASLKLLRLGKQGSASDPSSRDPFLGFGNPLLNGGGGDRSAWARQACGKTTALRNAKRSANRAAPPALSELYRGAVANVDMLRQATPLPETADELCAVAHSLGAPDSAVYLGERATVSQIKSLSASGALGRARAIHFATHGLVAGETALFFRNHVEPALLMTPPDKDKVTPEDDGLLKASDVTGLKLNADWVVMSACNTAAGGEGGEALSGLARAFFYAGARSMLVSHWYVDSNAAVEITTGAFSALKADPAIGRDEALRRSLSALIAKGGDNAHPSVWAPFVLVGDGGRMSADRTAGAAASTASVSKGPAVDAPQRVLRFAGPGKLAAVSSGGRRAVAPAQDGSVTVWDLETGKPVRKLIGSAAQGKSFSLSADGRLLAGATPDGTSIGLWDADSGQSRGSIAAGAGRKFSREAVVLSPDGRWLAAEQYGAADHGASVGVWNAASGSLTRMLEARFDDVRSLAFSGDGGRLAVSDSKGALLVFDVKTGKAEFSAKLHPAEVRLAALSPDGRVLAAAGAGAGIRLWDVAAGKQLDPIAARAGTIAALAFAHDGRLLVAGGDGAVEFREAPASASGR